MSNIVEEMKVTMENMLKEVEKMQDLIKEYDEFVENNCSNEDLVGEFDEIEEMFAKFDKLWNQSL